MDNTMGGKAHLNYELMVKGNHLISIIRTLSPPNKNYRVVDPPKGLPSKS
jgi:hypothetical protein